jgi:hypothetical protein
MPSGARVPRVLRVRMVHLESGSERTGPRCCANAATSDRRLLVADVTVAKTVAAMIASPAGPERASRKERRGRSQQAMYLPAELGNACKSVDRPAAGCATCHRPATGASPAADKGRGRWRGQSAYFRCAVNGCPSAEDAVGREAVEAAGGLCAPGRRRKELTIQGIRPPRQVLPPDGAC